MTKIGKIIYLLFCFILIGGLVGGGISLLNKTKSDVAKLGNPLTVTSEKNNLTDSSEDTSSEETSQSSETVSEPSSSEMSSESSSEVSSEILSESTSESTSESSSESSSENPPVVTYSNTPMQWGAVGSYGPTYWRYSNLDELPTWNDVSFYNNNNHTEYSLSNQTYQGITAVIGSDRYNALDEWIAERVDPIEYAYATLNYSGSISTGVDIAFAYSYDIMNGLVDVASQTQSTFELPCLYFDDTIMAKFVVSPNGIDLKTFDALVNSVELVFESQHEYAYTSSGAPGQATYYSATYILFHFNPGYISNVTTIRLLNDNNHGSYYDTTRVVFFPKNGQNISA